EVGWVCTTRRSPDASATPQHRRTLLSTILPASWRLTLIGHLHTWEESASHEQAATGVDPACLSGHSLEYYRRSVWLLPGPWGGGVTRFCRPRCATPRSRAQCQAWWRLAVWSPQRSLTL